MNTDAHNLNENVLDAVGEVIFNNFFVTPTHKTTQMMLSSSPYNEELIDELLEYNNVSGVVTSTTFDTFTRGGIVAMFGEQVGIDDNVHMPAEVSHIYQLSTILKYALKHKNMFISIDTIMEKYDSYIKSWNYRKALVEGFFVPEEQLFDWDNLSQQFKQCVVDNYIPSDYTYEEMLAFGEAIKTGDMKQAYNHIKLCDTAIKENVGYMLINYVNKEFWNKHMTALGYVEYSDM